MEKVMDAVKVVQPEHSAVKENVHKWTYSVDMTTTIMNGPISLKNAEQTTIQETEQEKINEKKAALHMLEVAKKENKFVKYINNFLKRCMDLAGGIVGLFILIPLIIVVAILNFLNKNNGPLFYYQERIGKNGKIFKMYKFRTMVVGADEKLKKMLEENEDLRKEWEENRKLKDDPRITPIGAFLRKTSLDEFPQFINVIIGQLSLVGPRAVIEDEIDKFGVYKYDVLSVKPGITGYWAANGRSDTTYDERVFMETKYARNWTVWMDIKLLFKTVLSVIKKEGAV